MTKAAVAALVTSGGWVPVDAGPLRHSAALENLAVLWIHLALIEGRRRGIGFKLLDRG